MRSDHPDRGKAPACDDVRAKLRSTIKRPLAKHGYPPDAQPTAIDLVIRQMETFADEWSPEAHQRTA